MYLVKKISALSKLWSQGVLSPVDSELSCESLLEEHTHFMDIQKSCGR